MSSSAGRWRNVIRECAFSFQNQLINTYPPKGQGRESIGCNCDVIIFHQTLIFHTARVYKKSRRKRMFGKRTEISALVTLAARFEQ